MFSDVEAGCLAVLTPAMYSSLHMFGISHQKGRWQETDHASITDCNNAGRTAVVVRFPPPLSSKRGGGRERETRFSVKAFENRSRSSILVIRSRRNYTFSRSRHPSTSLGHTNGQRPLSCPVVSPLQGEAVVLAFNSFSRASSVGLCNRTHYDGGLDHVVAANMFLHVDANDQRHLHSLSLSPSLSPFSEQRRALHPRAVRLLRRLLPSIETYPPSHT